MDFDISVLSILEAISPETDDQDHDGDLFETAAAIMSSNIRRLTVSPRVPKYEDYRHGLEPLIELEERLTKLLSTPKEEEPTKMSPNPGDWRRYGHYDEYDGYHAGPSLVNTNCRPSPTVYIPSFLPPTKSVSLPASPQTASTVSDHSLPHTSPSALSTSSKSKHKEVAVHTTTNWKRALTLGGSAKSPKSENSGEIAGWWEDPDDPVHVLNAMAQPMLDLWRDKYVRRMLKEKRLRLEESSGL
jgi:hypothetical protein